MKRLLPLFVLVLAAGCSFGGGGGDRWGGYTESEAKEILADPNIRAEILKNAPGDPATSPYRRLYPTKEQAEGADLRKVTFEGQESWQYQHPDENFCVYVWEDQTVDPPSWSVMPSPCVAD